MATLLSGGARGSVFLTHSERVVELQYTQDADDGVLELPWAGDAAVVACGTDGAGSAVACTEDKRVLLWEWDEQ